MTDDYEVNKIEVNVEQTVMYKSDSPDNKYVIIQYEIFNYSEISIDDVFAQYTSDFDFPGGALGGYDPSLQLSYAYEETGSGNSNYYGMMLLDKQASGHSIFKNLQDTSYIRSTSNLTIFASDPTVSGDTRNQISSGPYTIPVEGSFIVRFVFLAGDDLNDLKTSAAAARNLFSPDSPTGLVASPSNNAVNLSWNGVESPEVSKYYIYYSESDNPDQLIDSVTTMNITHKKVSGLTNDTQYYFAVKASTGSGILSGMSNIVSATPNDGTENIAKFDGVNDYGARQTPYAAATDITMESWVNFNSLDGNAIVFYNGNTGSAGMGLFRIGDKLYYLGGGYVLTEITSLTANGWNHWTISRASDGLVKVYKNGEQIYSSYQPAAGVPYNENLYIAGRAGAEFNAAEYSEFRMWNTVRTAPQIQANYNVKATGSEDNLVVCYHFEESEGALFAEDISPNGYNLNLYGGVAFQLSPITLPVELASFTAQANNGKIRLSWSTVTESNNAGWEVEVSGQQSAVGSQQENSRDNSDVSPFVKGGLRGFFKIGFIAGKGTTTDEQSYQFQMSNSDFTSTKLLFRLKQIDFDGKINYSNILEVDLTPENFGLSQNYPNPFNPETVINYQIKTQSDVRLVVFDLLGREVATLVNEKKEIGNYLISFSAVNLPSGVYFYKLTAGSFSETKKMTVLK